MGILVVIYMTNPEQIDKYISELPKWHADWISMFRKLLLEVKPDLKEEWKWSTPVWSGNKMIAAASGFKTHVKLNFLNGAKFADKDESKLFNSGLDSKNHRGIDLKEGDKIDEAELKKLIQIAVDAEIYAN